MITFDVDYIAHEVVEPRPFYRLGLEEGDSAAAQSTAS